MTKPNRARAAYKEVDERYGSSNFLRRSMNKVFPDHWSFMIGEIALYSFIILLLTGVYLTFFFDASPQEVIYNGSYVPLKGLSMSQAYASSIDISFDVRAGLLFRQMHHWAALLFAGSIVVHMFRVFFTGAFRKPREANWVIGGLLLVLSIAEGFAGYSLPDDLLSGTGLRIAYSIAESIPVIGTWAAYLVWGGEYPNHIIIQRLYGIHILLIPGIILALIGAHLGLVWYQKHTQFPGPGKTEKNVIGARVWPVFAAKSAGFSFVTFAMLAALGGLAQINPIWLYGPYDPSKVSAASQPDWYMAWLDGSSRLMPPFEFHSFGYDVPPIFWPTVVMAGAVFTLFFIYPWLEARYTGDREIHNLLERPRDNPTRTAIGFMSITFYLVLMISGGNDVIARIFDISLNSMIWFGRIALFVLPPIAFWATKRICIALQKKEHELWDHGIETGIVRQLPSGEFIEVHAPKNEPPLPQLVPVDPAHVPAAELPAGRERGGTMSRAGRAVTDFFTAPKE